jgi:hypothetical protein
MFRLASLLELAENEVMGDTAWTPDEPADRWTAAGVARPARAPEPVFVTDLQRWIDLSA